MHLRRLCWLVAVSGLMAACGTALAASLGSGFTYQGQIKHGGVPCPGPADLWFSLWDAASGGAQYGSTISRPGVNLSGGLFATELDFGPTAFDGNERWLEIYVRYPSGTGGYVVLPRQKLTAAPYALSALGPWRLSSSNLYYTAGSVSIGTSNPEARFQVAGGAIMPAVGNSPAAGIQFPANAGGGSGDEAFIRYYITSGEDMKLQIGINNDGNDVIAFSQYGEDMMTIRNSNVGIGQGNPTAKLHIGGTAGVDGIKFPDGTLQTTAAWRLTGNPGTSPGSHFLGTTDNQSMELKVNNARALRVQPAADPTYPSATVPNWIGGASLNTVNAGVAGAVIAGGGGWNTDGTSLAHVVAGNFGTIGGGKWNTAGGGSSSYATVSGGWHNAATGGSATIAGGSNNTASDRYATISGGAYNEATQDYSTVSGGSNNEASEQYATVAGGSSNDATQRYTFIGGGADNNADGDYSTVGGGHQNRAGEYLGPGYASIGHATVAGGWYNIASGADSAIGGGYYNTASGLGSVVLGGEENQAGGTHSFAAGYRAKVRDGTQSGDYDGDEGTFVWADATNADFTSSGPNRFMVRAAGGTYIYSNSALTGGVRLQPGASAWSTVSDRAAKENFSAVEGQELLEKLAAMPVQTWNYRSQDRSIRHMGPMAQDFHSAFGIGEDDKSISTVDADGVALAGVQALYQLVQDQNAEIAALQADNEQIKAQMAELLAEVKKIKAVASAGR
ncbi:MAG: hypothetical protein AMXMBFR13_20810 [Phycisphaerae bacterium]